MLAVPSLVAKIVHVRLAVLMLRGVVARLIQIFVARQEV